MNYEQFIQSQIRRHERVLADIRAGRVFWCETCECWGPMDEKRQDPWGGDWPMCAECLAESGPEDYLLDASEVDEGNKWKRNEFALLPDFEKILDCFGVEEAKD